ncbi:FCD domain-containing protein [Xylophilus rhododendri]|uniref:FCD domain-containing protein n=1 Tax=Xylophilus rhododendri TaxID=2697032 RepID=A0A857J707_9BURK|nr:GntR family transcriptional regulator [Xylophilus rhododendri]QHI99487.1 FCD domain-containing protein [Xylophilus rhododendri]
MPASQPQAATAAAQDSEGRRLVRKTAVELVVDEVRARILSGECAPGSPLRQEALAEELGVSRIPLREAMRLLSSEGLVDLIPHRGSFVSMLSTEEVQEFFDLRLRLEPWLFRQASTQLTEAELQAATSLVDRMDSASASEWGPLNWQLHGLLYGGARRPAAVNLVRTLHEKSERYFRFQAVNADIRQQSRQEHLELIALCRQRQPDLAEQAMERHIADAAGHILQIVRRYLDAPGAAA